MSAPRRVGGLIRYAIDLGNQFTLNLTLTEIENMFVIERM